MCPRPAPLDLRHRGDRFCVAVHDCLIAVVWGRVVEGVDLHDLAKIQRDVVGELGHCLVVTIIRAGLEMTVKDEVREGSAHNMREFANTNFGSAVVVESGGFRAVFFRSVLTSVQLVSRSPVKQKVFSDIGDAVRWLHARPGVNPKLSSSTEGVISGVIAIADEYGES